MASGGHFGACPAVGRLGFGYFLQKRFMTQNRASCLTASWPTSMAAMKFFSAGQGSGGKNLGKVGLKKRVARR